MSGQDWALIDEFPRYSINIMGEVLDSQKQTLVAPHIVTGGALAVRLRDDDGYFHMRSLKVLVANKFVDIDFDGEFFDLALFETPILLDNNQHNVAASNIRWRPRWFAWQYTHQFKDVKDEYYRGPLKCFQNTLVFKDVISVGMHYGLLFDKIYLAAKCFEDDVYYDHYYDWPGKGDMPPPIWPIGKSFAFIN